MKIPSNAKILYDKAVVAIEEKKYTVARNYLIECLQIEPNFPEALSAAIFLNQKLQEFNSELLDVLSKELKKQKTKLPDMLQQEIENLRHLKQKDIDIYKWFRDWVSEIKKMSERDPKDEIKKKLSNTNLCNLEDTIEILKDLKEEYPDEKDIANYYKVFTRMVENGILTYVPYLIQKKIKQTILKLSMKYDRIQIVEIAEKSEEPEDIITIIVENMIEAGEIYAEYFRSTNAVLFDKQKSNADMDTLMKKFESWENNYCKNCNKRIKGSHQQICEYCGEEL